MAHRIVGVAFETRAQANAPGRFTVPSEVCDILGIDKGAIVLVQVESRSGRHGPVERELKSDREPSPVGEMRDWMEAGERIVVTIRRP